MTYEALINKIKQLRIKRAEAHGNYAEQDRINKLLDKLYEKYYLMVEQVNKGNYDSASSFLSR